MEDKGRAERCRRTDAAGTSDNARSSPFGRLASVRRFPDDATALPGYTAPKLPIPLGTGARRAGGP
jgi:hypothetical protein